MKLRHVFVAGGTSDVGERVVGGLTTDYSAQNITCLVRKTSDVRQLEKLGINLRVGDITDPQSYPGLLGPDVLYLDMTHPKYYHRSIDVVKEQGVKRAFFITTTGLFSQYRSAAEIYQIGEARIKDSGCIWTILRPSMIYGTERDRNMTKLLRFINRYPIFPVFGDGKSLMQPVYVADLAAGILSALRNVERTENKAYNLCGPQTITYIELLQKCRDALGSKIKFVHIPHGLAVIAATVGEKIPGFPVTREQVMRISENKSFDISLAQRELGYNPRSFAEGIRQEVETLRARGFLKG
ncbi:MAG: NAD-dependent epimerase/dehydratase family protein [Negativicutes bacterium]